MLHFDDKTFPEGNIHAEMLVIPL